MFNSTQTDFVSVLLIAPMLHQLEFVSLSCEIWKNGNIHHQLYSPPLISLSESKKLCFRLQVLLCITYSPNFDINGDSILRIAEVGPPESVFRVASADVWDLTSDNTQECFTTVILISNMQKWIFWILCSAVVFRNASEEKQSIQPSWFTSECDCLYPQIIVFLYFD